MSPRKSSTSSGKPPSPLRPRYLGLEVAGEHLPPVLSPRWWDATLHGALRAAGGPDLPLRLVRVEGARAIVSVSHRDVARVRAAWNPPPPTGVDWQLRTRRTWGTLVGAKAWLRQRPVRRD